MILHDTLSILIAILGLFVGGYMITRIKRLPKDKILILDFVMLSLVNLYIGMIYLLFTIGVIPTLEDLSFLIRPVIPLQIILPALISWRMGAI